MIEVKEFVQYLTNFDDIIGLYYQRFLSKAYKDLNLDSVRLRANGNLINVEHHSFINKPLLSRDFEYLTSLHAASGSIVHPFIFNTSEIPELMIDYANPTIFYNPIWINTKEIEGSVRLNNIKYKLLNEDVINVFDVLDLIWMPKFRLSKNIEDIIVELVEIYEQLIISDDLAYILRRSLILWAGKHVINDENLDKVKRGLKMSAMEIGSLEEDIKASRISGALMRSEEEGRKEGRKEGIEDTEKRFVSKFLESMSPEEISEKFDIPIEKVLSIQNSNG